MNIYSVLLNAQAGLSSSADTTWAHSQNRKTKILFFPSPDTASRHLPSDRLASSICHRLKPMLEAKRVFRKQELGGMGLKCVHLCADRSRASKGLSEFHVSGTSPEVFHMQLILKQIVRDWKNNIILGTYLGKNLFEISHQFVKKVLLSE